MSIIDKYPSSNQKNWGVNQAFGPGSLVQIDTPEDWKEFVAAAPKPTEDFAQAVDDVAALVKKKNAAYGNSFGTAGEALKILYPDGVKPEQYAEALLVTRIWDKLKRLATNNDPFGESPFVDIAGYAMCGITLHKKAEKTEK